MRHRWRVITHDPDGRADDGSPTVRSEPRAFELGLPAFQGRPRRWVHYECLGCGTRLWLARHVNHLPDFPDGGEVLPDCDQESVRLVMVS